MGAVMKRIVVVLALLLVAVLGMQGAAASATEITTGTDLDWSAPTRVDQQSPYSSSLSLTDVSCPASNLCVAVDNAGDVLVSTDPAAGANGWGAPMDIAGNDVISSVSCPTTTLCVAVGPSVTLTSTDPIGGSSAWVASYEGGGFSVSCPSASFCMEFVDWGLYETFDPTTGAAYGQGVIGSTVVVGVYCASVSLCFATTGSTILDVTTDPMDSSPTWQASQPSGDNQVEGVSCLSSGLCVAVGSNGWVETSTSPGTGSWSGPVDADPGQDLNGVACLSDGGCVAVDGNGQVIASSNPTGDAASWSQAGAVDPGESLSAVSCTPTDVCVTVDGAGAVAVSTHPLSTWAPAASVDGTDALNDSSCGSLTMCVAVGDSGTVVTSTAPTQWWNLPLSVDGANTLQSVSCPSSSFCAAADDVGNVVTSGQPVSAWNAPLSVDGTNSVNSISCPSTTLCVAVDSAGNAITSTDPAAAWNAPVDIDAGNALTSVSCPSTQLCVAVDDVGDIISSTDPTGGASSWSSVDLSSPSSGEAFASISCASTSLCVALAGKQVVTSTTPTGPAGAWSFGWVNSAPPLFGDGSIAANSVSCPTTAYCIAVDPMGDYIDTSGPAGGAAGWGPLMRIDGTGKPTLTAVSCYTAELCVAVDAQGNVIVGQQPPTSTAAGANPIATGEASSGSALDETPSNSNQSGGQGSNPVSTAGRHHAPSRKTILAHLAATVRAVDTYITNNQATRLERATFGFTAPSSGTLSLTVTARLEARRRTLLHVAEKFMTAGRRDLKLRLSSADSSLLHVSKRPAFTVSATFVPLGRSPVTFRVPAIRS
jgi:hypothetical protein